MTTEEKLLIVGEGDVITILAKGEGEVASDRSEGRLSEDESRKEENAVHLEINIKMFHIYPNISMDMIANK